MPHPVDASSEADLVKRLRQHLGDMSEEILFGPAPPRSVDQRQQLPRGPILSLPGARQSPSQEQALAAPGPSCEYIPSSAHYEQSNFIDLTGATDVGGSTQIGQVSVTGEAQSSSPPAAKGKSTPNTKLRSGSMFAPKDDPWLEQNGIAAWKIQYPGDTIKLSQREPPYTSYDDYPRNSKGLYRCLCEGSQRCKSCGTGISASDLRKRVDKRLQTWRRKIEKMIKEGKLNAEHKTWDQDFLKPPMTAEEREREKKQAQLRKAEQQQADANLTANQPLVSGDLFAGAAGFRDREPSSTSTGQPMATPQQPFQPQTSGAQVHEIVLNQPEASGDLFAATAGFGVQQPSSKSSVQPIAPPQQLPKPKITAKEAYEQTASIRKTFIGRKGGIENADLEYFYTFWAAKNAKKLGQVLTPTEEFWLRQQHLNSMPDAALEKFWAKNFPESEKGQAARQRIAERDAKEQAKEQAAQREKEQADQRLRVHAEQLAMIQAEQ